MQQFKANFAHPLNHGSWGCSAGHHGFYFVFDTASQLRLSGDQKIVNNRGSAVMIDFVLIYSTKYRGSISAP
jgi:hypothetical protein